MKLKDALSVPAVCGLNVTVNDALCPEGMVAGKLIPPMLNAELFVLAALTVTLVPLAVSVPVALPLVPTTTLPRPSVPGETAS